MTTIGTTPGQPPTPDDVRGLWNFMTQHYGTTVIDKSDAAEMQIVSELLDKLGILDRDNFLLHYATTWGKRIYVPFHVGEPFNEWDLWGQIVVCVHEHEHVEQENRLGLATYAARYIGSPSTRADYEAEAYRSSFELGWWHTRTVPSPARVARALSGYGVSDTDIAVVQKTLELSAVSIEHGAIVNKATSVALGWLNQHAPHLRAS